MTGSVFKKGSAILDWTENHSRMWRPPNRNRYSSLWVSDAKLKGMPLKQRWAAGPPASQVVQQQNLMEIKKKKLRIPEGVGGMFECCCYSGKNKPGRSENKQHFCFFRRFNARREITLFSYITVAVLFSPNASVDISQNNDDCFLFFFANL